jgi:hypothetical protein
MSRLLHSVKAQLNIPLILLAAKEGATLGADLASKFSLPLPLLTSAALGGGLSVGASLIAVEITTQRAPQLSDETQAFAYLYYAKKSLRAEF